MQRKKNADTIYIMEKKKLQGGDRNIVLLIILFILISLVIFLGRFIIKNPQAAGGRIQAATAVEKPEINRVSEEESVLQLNEAVQTPEEPVKEPEKEEPAPEEVEARLFYYWLSTEGDLTMKSVLRPMESDDYRLEGVIKELLKGPVSGEVDKHYMTFIPKGTRLNQVKLLSRTVRLDFSEEFSFNPIGYEGFNAQLKQIVYTVTEFSQVDQVLFTIDGELRDYINGEAMFTGEPLSRDSFKD